MALKRFPLQSVRDEEQGGVPPQQISAPPSKTFQPTIPQQNAPAEEVYSAPKQPKKPKGIRKVPLDALKGGDAAAVSALKQAGIQQQSKPSGISGKETYAGAAARGSAVAAQTLAAPQRLMRNFGESLAWWADVANPFDNVPVSEANKMLAKDQYNIRPETPRGLDKFASNIQSQVDEANTDIEDVRNRQTSAQRIGSAATEGFIGIAPQLPTLAVGGGLTQAPRAVMAARAGIAGTKLARAANVAGQTGLSAAEFSVASALHDPDSAYESGLHGAKTGAILGVGSQLAAPLNRAAAQAVAARGGGATAQKAAYISADTLSNSALFGGIAAGETAAAGGTPQDVYEAFATDTLLNIPLAATHAFKAPYARARRAAVPKKPPVKATLGPEQATAFGEVRDAVTQEYGLEATDISPIAAETPQQQVAQRVGKALGFDVIVVDGKGAEYFNGVTTRNPDNKTILISRYADNPGDVVFWHEYTHRIKQEDPELYAKFESAAKKYQKDQSAARQHALKQLEAEASSLEAGGATDIPRYEQVMRELDFLRESKDVSPDRAEEFLADTLASISMDGQMNRRDFLRKVAGQNRTAVTKLADFMSDLVEDLRIGAKGELSQFYDTRGLLDNVEKLSGEIRDLLSEPASGRTETRQSGAERVQETSSTREAAQGGRGQSQFTYLPAEGQAGADIPQTRTTREPLSPQASADIPQTRTTRTPQEPVAGPAVPQRRQTFGPEGRMNVEQTDAPLQTSREAVSLVANRTARETRPDVAAQTAALQLRDTSLAQPRSRKAAEAEMSRVELKKAAEVLTETRREPKSQRLRELRAQELLSQRGAGGATRDPALGEQAISRAELSQAADVLAREPRKPKSKRLKARLEGGSPEKTPSQITATEKTKAPSGGRVGGKPAPRAARVAKSKPVEATQKTRKAMVDKLMNMRKLSGKSTAAKDFGHIPTGDEMDILENIFRDPELDMLNEKDPWEVFREENPLRFSRRVDVKELAKQLGEDPEFIAATVMDMRARMTMEGGYFSTADVLNRVKTMIEDGRISAEYAARMKKKTKPRAVFIGWQEGFGDHPSLPMFNVENHPTMENSTVSADSLKAAGIEIPKHPPKPEGMYSRRIGSPELASEAQEVAHRVTGQGIKAFKMPNGEIVYDPAARTHLEAIRNLGLKMSHDLLMNGGHINPIDGSFIHNDDVAGHRKIKDFLMGQGREESILNDERMQRRGNSFSRRLISGQESPKEIYHYEKRPLYSQAARTVEEHADIFKSLNPIEGKIIPGKEIPARTTVNNRTGEVIVIPGRTVAGKTVKPQSVLEQAVALLKANGVKDAELKFLQLDDPKNFHPDISGEELSKYIRENQLVLEENLRDQKPSGIDRVFDPDDPEAQAAIVPFEMFDTVHERLGHLQFYELDSLFDTQEAMSRTATDPTQWSAFMDNLRDQRRVESDTQYREPEFDFASEMEAEEAIRDFGSFDSVNERVDHLQYYFGNGALGSREDLLSTAADPARWAAFITRVSDDASATTEGKQESDSFPLFGHGSKIYAAVEPGGKDYREYTIRPLVDGRPRGVYHEPHFDEPDIVVHARADIRVDKDGVEVFHVDEIQSEVSNALRTSKKSVAKFEKTRRELENSIADFTQRFTAAHEKTQKLLTDLDPRYTLDSVKQLQDELPSMLRRIAPYGSFGDKIIWDPTNGGSYRTTMNAGIGAPRARVAKVTAALNELYALQSGLSMERKTVQTNEVNKQIIKKLQSLPFVGDPKKGYGQLAFKRMIQEAAQAGHKRLTWWKAEIHNKRWGRDDSNNFDELYDSIYPSVAKKLAKSFGSYVGETMVNTTNAEQLPAWYIDITPEMADTQPVFSRRLNLSNLEKKYTEALAEKPGEQTIGDPRRANPIATREGRRFGDTVDELMAEQGLPERQKRTDIESEAQKRVLDNYAEARKMVLDRARSGAGYTDAVETEVAKIVRERETMQALRSGDKQRLEEATEIHYAYRQSRAEVGRTLQQGYDPYKTPEERYKLFVGQAMLGPIKDQISKGDIGRTASEALEMKHKLKKRGYDIDNWTDTDWSDRDKVLGLVREIGTMRKGVSDKIYEWWINSILSGPQTHMANIIGNTINSGVEYGIIRPLESMLNSVTNKRGTTVSDLSAGLYNPAVIGQALIRSLKNMRVAWATEFSTMRLDVDQTLESALKGELAHGPSIGGKTGRVVRAPTRALMAMDEFAKGFSGTIEATIEAHRIARQEGRTGKDMYARVNEMVDDLDSPAWHTASEKARYITFQQELGKSAEALNTFVKTVPGGRYIVPFVRTPINIFKRGLSLTPLGSIPLAARTLSGRASRSEVTRGLSQQGFAWAATMALWQMVQDDEERGYPLITGTLPFSSSTAGEREHAYRTMQPQSLRVGDKVVTYSRIEPLATTIASVVDAMNAAKKQSAGAPRGEVLNEAFTSIVGQMKDKTFLQGFSMLIGALEDERQLARFVGNMGASFVPNVVRQPMRELDPELRETRIFGAGRGKSDVGEAWEHRFLRRVGQQAVPAVNKAPGRKDLYGNQIEREGHPAIRALMPVRIKDLSKVPEELKNIDQKLWLWNKQNPEATYWPSSPRPEIRLGGAVYKLSDDEFVRYQERAGHWAKEMIKPYMDNEDPLTRSDIDYFRSAFSQARSIARSEMLRELIDKYGDPRSITGEN